MQLTFSECPGHGWLPQEHHGGRAQQRNMAGKQCRGREARDWGSTQGHVFLTPPAHPEVCFTSPLGGFLTVQFNRHGPLLLRL